MRALAPVSAAALTLALSFGTALAQDTTKAPTPAPAPAPAPPPTDTATPAAPAPQQAAAPAPAPAQAPGNAISPGMSEADVRARWGNPALTRTSGNWKFLYYRNGQERSVGWLDVVFLQGGQVVDCIARGDGHIYTGDSSSPPDRLPEATIDQPARRDSSRAAVTGVRVRP